MDRKKHTVLRVPHAWLLLRFFEWASDGWDLGLADPLQ